MSRRLSLSPAPTEQEWQTVQCADGTAFRLWVHPGSDGYVRLQQLAWGDDIGWYVQKTLLIPGEALPLLLPQLRQARCMIPVTQEAALATPDRLRLVSPEPAAERRGA